MHLPSGHQTIGGVIFDIRGIVQLTGPVLRQRAGDVFPSVVSGIRVHRKCRHLHFLHVSWLDCLG